MGSAACWIGATACQCLCSLFGLCGATKKVFSRIGYVMFMVLWIILSIIFLFYGHYIFKIPFIEDYVSCDTDNDACIGVSAVLRTSFTLTLFHLLLFLVCLCGGDVVSALNEGAWPLKIIVVMAFFVLTLFMPTNFFKGFGYVAMVASFLYLIYQMILIIDMAYSWNSNWVGKYDVSNSGSGGNTTCWAVIIITATVLTFGAAILIYVLLYLYEASSVADYIVISAPIVAGVVYTGLTVSPIVKGGSIFTCGLILLFQSFLTASVQLSRPDSKSDATSKSAYFWQMAIGLGYMFFVLFYVGAKTKKTEVEKKNEEPAQQVTSKAGDVVAEEAGDEGKVPLATSSGKEADEVQKVTLATAMFHLLMAFASMYYSMVISNWGSPTVNGKETQFFSSKILSYGALLAGQWLGVLFFIWSLIAPRVCPSREFSYN